MNKIELSSRSSSIQRRQKEGKIDKKKDSMTVRRTDRQNEEQTYKQKVGRSQRENLCLLKYNQSIHNSGFKYPPFYLCVYLENKNAYLKQETSEIVVKSIHHGGFLFNFIIINLKSSENKER